MRVAFVSSLALGSWRHIVSRCYSAEVACLSGSVESLFCRYILRPALVASVAFGAPCTASVYGCSFMGGIPHEFSKPRKHSIPDPVAGEPHRRGMTQDGHLRRGTVWGGSVGSGLNVSVLGSTTKKVLETLKTQIWSLLVPVLHESWLSPLSTPPASRRGAAGDGSTRSACHPTVGLKKSPWSILSEPPEPGYSPRPES